MEEKLNEYIFHNTSFPDGSGVFVGNLFITAGHLFSNQKKATISNGDKKFELKKEDALICLEIDEKNPDPKGYDIAIFRLKDQNSPIVLDDTEPYIGMNLTSLSYKHRCVKIKDDSSSLKNTSQNKEFYEFLKCSVVVQDIDHNFILGETSIILQTGSSGSPLFNGNKLIGILRGGIDNICGFQSSISILKLLKQYNIKP